MSEVDWHREMLADLRRVRAMGEAVSAAVKPGDLVLDVGTGSGVLAMLACRAGAARVYAIERGHILEVARQLARHNGLADRIEFIAGSSIKVELPQRVDLAVAELIGDFGLEERIWPVFDDVRRRFLKEGGRLLPDELELFLAPTAEGAQYLDWAAALKGRFDLDFAPLTELSMHVSRNLWAAPEQLLGPGASMLRCDLYRDGPKVPEGQVQVRVERAGILAGWIGWFAARQEGRTLLSTAPPIKGSSWSNVFFPIGAPVAVEAGDELSLKVCLNRRFWYWEFSLDRLGIQRRLSDFFSYPPGVFKPKKRAG